MSRTATIAEGLRRLNEGGNLEAWGRRAKVSVVNELAHKLGIVPRSTKAATVSAISRAPRPALVEQGVSALTSGRSLRAWGRRVRVVEVSALARQLGVPARGTKAELIEAIATRPNAADVLRNQAKAFPRALSKGIKGAEAIFDNARLRLFQDLATVSSGSMPVRMARFNTALRNWGNTLKRNLKAHFRANEREMHRLATRHFAELFGPDVPRGTLGRQRALRMADAVVDKLVAEMMIRMSRMLVTKVQQPSGRTARELAGPAKFSTVNSYKHRARLSARMEMLRAYNEAQVALAQDFPALRGQVFQKRIVELFDDRNHPFSRAANGTVSGIGEPFKVPVKEVRRAASALNKSAAGVFWSVQDNHYVGMSLPAHYNDRGRIVVELIAA